MEIKNIEIKKLKPAEYNPREMSLEEMESLKKSIKEFGLVEPIVINKDFVIIGGHQRVYASEDLGKEKVPCVVVDLDKKKEKILNLALNRITGDWDTIKLSRIINELNSRDDLLLSGFNESEVNQLLVEFKMDFGENEKINFDDNEELKKIFERHEKVEIPVERPKVLVKKDKIAFYCENMEQWNKIKEKYKTTRKGELDINKLIK